MSNAKTPDTNKQADIDAFKVMKMQWGDPKLVKEHVRACFAVGEVPGILGKAGIGKTAVVGQLAKEMTKETGIEHGYISIQLQHLEKEDLAGFPFPDPEDGGSVVMRLLKRLPREGKCEERGILFLDEFNRADKSVTNAAFPLMEEGRIGDWQLPKGWHVVIAGNISDDQYSVNEAEKDPAIRRRICWVGMVCNSRQWLQYAKTVGMHRSVIEFIQSNPDALYDDDAHRIGAIGASPASWEKVSKSLLVLHEGDKLSTTKIAGNVGLPVALSFCKFHEEIANKPPPPLEILQHLHEDERLQTRIKNLEPGEIANLTSAILRVLGESTSETNIDTVETNLVGYLELVTNEGFQNFVSLLVQNLSTMSGPANVILDRLTKNNKYLARAGRVQKSIYQLLHDKKIITDGSNKDDTETKADDTETKAKVK